MVSWFAFSRPIPKRRPGETAQSRFGESLWGLVMSVRDVDECAKLLGPAVGKVKPAVQKNKCITTVRKEAGASAAIAFLGPPAK